MEKDRDVKAPLISKAEVEKRLHIKLKGDKTNRFIQTGADSDMNLDFLRIATVTLVMLIIGL
ncbi:MAG: hypothetical protein ABSB40_05025 [Nitrososphaeria archaeon]|jgi:hypothetical protein